MRMFLSCAGLTAMHMRAESALIQNAEQFTERIFLFILLRISLLPFPHLPKEATAFLHNIGGGLIPKIPTLILQISRELTFLPGAKPFCKSLRAFVNRMPSSRLIRLSKQIAEGFGKQEL